MPLPRSARPSMPGWTGSTRRRSTAGGSPRSWSGGRSPVAGTRCGSSPSAAPYAGRTVGPRMTRCLPPVRAGLRESLRRLGTEHVDVLQVHDPDPTTPIEETWAAIAELVTEGLVRAGGLSNHPVELMERARGVAPVAVVQHQYSVLHRSPETDGVSGLVCRQRQRVPGLVTAGFRFPLPADSTWPRSPRATCATACPGRPRP